MLIFAVIFLLGIIFLQCFIFLPSLYILLVFVIFIGIILKLKNNHRYFFWVVPLLLGFSWGVWVAHSKLAWILPPMLEGKPVTITGMISSIPSQDLHRASFKFAMQSLQYADFNLAPHATLQLSWQSPPKNLKVGDQWKLTVYLKKIHGLMNPGGFDFEKWSYQEGIRATGNIANRNYFLLSSQLYHHPIDRIRQYFKNEITENLKKSTTSHWIVALAVGERDGIPLDDWQILRDTGTNHLMAIAGLHIGFMSGFAFTLVMWLWARQPKLVLKIPAQHAGAIAALFVGWIYSAMAGFSLPTQRACLMLSVFLITVLSRRKILPWHTFSLALVSVLLMNPLNVLSVSFWLSFCSIALIIYGMRGRLAPTGLWWKHGRIQWVITLGLIPINIGLFHECSWVSFIANCIAIPCVGFFIVPLTLLGCFSLLFSAKLGGFILGLADKILNIVWMILSYLAHLSWNTWYQFVPMGDVFIACIGIVILLLPRGFPGRVFGFIGLLPMFFYQPKTPVVGDVWVSMLDVGQGLSAIVQTHQHVLVFDTGSRLNEKNDMGENVVIPFLHTLHISHIDKLVISHGDNDHIGGAESILKSFPTYVIKSSVPEKFLTVPASYCLRGETWQWDNINFEFLYPTADKLGLNNDSSCVLRITCGTKHLLLTGDIQKIAENDLVGMIPSKLAADVLIAPHHGSKTSSLDEFISLVHPKLVLFPIGYRNRYHFPHAIVVQKYRDLGAILVNSVEAGTIQVNLTPNLDKPIPIKYRNLHREYWRESL